MTSEERAGLPALLGSLLALAALFVLLVALGFHGFSFSKWHDIIDGSAAPEVWLGEARYIRVDDWMVRIPLALAQSAHDPPFPLVNRNIGSGQNMLLPLAVPVAHFVSLFRPTLWGYFLGDDIGVSWAWWSQSLGLLAVWLAVLFTVTRGRLALSWAGGLLLCFAPYFQAFSFTYATLGIYAGLAWVAFLGVFVLERAVAVVACGLVLGFAGGAFVLVVYPAFQVGIGYLSLVVVAGCLWDRRHEIDWAARRGPRLAALGLAVLVSGAGLVSFYLGAGDALELVRGTEYPGGRVSTGGGGELWRLYAAHLGVLLETDDYRPVGSVAETVSFLYLFPIVFAATLCRRATWRGTDPMLVGLGLFCLVTELYRVVGFPEWLSRATLMSFVPDFRSIVALGLADLLLLMRFLSLPQRDEDSLPAWVAVAIAGGWGVLLALAATTWSELIPEIRPGWLAVLILVNTALAFLLVTRRRSVMVVGSAAALLALSTGWWNPLVRGGTAYVTENALSRAIREVDAAAEGETVWAAVGSSDRGNLFRMLGVASVGGAIMVPQLELWRRLDTAGDAEKVYNRYAHVGFAPGPPRFHLSSHHGFVLYVDPEQEILATLGVTHLMVSTKEGSRWRPYWNQFLPLEVIGEHYLFALPLERDSASL